MAPNTHVDIGGRTLRNLRRYPCSTLLLIYFDKDDAAARLLTELTKDLGGNLACLGISDASDYVDLICLGERTARSQAS
jgi:hypothetical protein